MHILLVDRTDDYDAPDVHGPFTTITEAQQYAERLRVKIGLPAEATPENNDTWTDAGWYFGIFEPRKEV